jgi:hypothetical protein
MKITRRKLAEMIEHEVRAHLSAVLEADDDKKGGKKSKKPTTAAADNEPTQPNAPADGGGVEPIASSPPIDGGMNDQEGESEDADGDGMPDPSSVDPTDGEGEDDADAIDPEGDGGEEPSGAVNDELSGKTVQAITIEPKSKVLPGAKEVVITFNESTDALRILVTSTGTVKFFWRGQLHDIP